jgi:hypothetical protein
MDLGKRWIAAVMLVAEKRLRPIIGYRDLAKLVTAIEKRRVPLASQQHAAPAAGDPAMTPTAV